MPKKIKKKRNSRMRYIKVPAPVVLENIPGGETKLSFADLIRKVLAGDTRTLQDDKSVDHFMLLTAQVKTVAPGDIWELESEVWEFLSLLARTFPNYHPEAKVSMLPLIKAITGATTEKPEKPKAAPAPATDTP